MARNVFYLIFIPGFGVVTFLIGGILATAAMSARVERDEGESEA